ncbi:hypothetical protein BCR42DRAFT_403342 [Absidia repens]|uniref:Uncharacterized protein n=1 Tax=Absidia repens TaxID=90262 RepID=A0A1X2IZA4_9FUNG|nr:hypothetical protein BCR42DRAFT_403342 [Absidia repens]
MYKLLIQQLRLLLMPPKPQNHLLLKPQLNKRRMRLLKPPNPPPIQTKKDLPPNLTTRKVNPSSQRLLLHDLVPSVYLSS